MQPISIEECLHSFDQQIKDAHKQIADEIHQISGTDGYVQEKMASFQNEINSLQFEGSNQFEKELASILSTYKRDCAVWCDSVNAFIKGKEFINQFEKSVLVVVFGNVNVGKSSVGDLIAGVTDPDSSKVNYEKDKKMLKHYYGKPPVFYEYDLAGNNASAKAERKQEPLFKEGHQETTAQIQYFTRNDGLTWTDSPGICSVNKDNGDLAKKYVEFADLVVFITTSSSPAKYDEVQELKKLFVKKKPLLILVNKSDMTVKDEVDGRIVKYLAPKTPQDRQKQEGYIRDLFRDGAMDVVSKVDSVSISTWLALQSMRTKQEEYAQERAMALKELHNQIFMQMGDFKSKVESSFKEQLEHAYCERSTNIDSALKEQDEKNADYSMKIELVTNLHGKANGLLQEIRKAAI